MLEISSLNVSYGRVQVLFDVSITVPEGELVTVIGANGAGKTTLLLTVSGVLKPQSGNIRFEGREIDNLPPHEIVKLGVGHVPQGKELFPAMTVLENLEMGAHMVRRREEFEARLERAFEFFPRLSERARQRAGTLSGGEQQMLAIARALMAMPRLLLLDEPSAGLAPIIVDHLAEIILGMNESGLTVLLVEQNAYLALELARKAYVMESGRVVESGDTGVVMESDLVRRAYLGI
ncbi:ABC transporter ATP-binding protein [Candidatus Spongiisocius sp.]|uniref:ABC transporter ATP-binding protein n=1 Tax=Candidatus Spongiisocius sp. TaxID=3101273 RepID=UPI003B5A0A61